MDTNRLGLKRERKKERKKEKVELEDCVRVVGEAEDFGLNERG